MAQETLYLAVNILSRYFRTVYVTKDNLQLIGKPSFLRAFLPAFFCSCVLLTACLAFCMP